MNKKLSLIIFAVFLCVSIFYIKQAVETNAKLQSVKERSFDKEVLILVKVLRGIEDELSSNRINDLTFKIGLLGILEFDLRGDKSGKQELYFANHGLINVMHDIVKDLHIDDEQKIAKYAASFTEAREALEEIFYSANTFLPYKDDIAYILQKLADELVMVSQNPLACRKTLCSVRRSGKFYGTNL